MARLVSHGQDGHFEIVNQLNRGAPLITSRDERERLAELTLLAGERAGDKPAVQVAAALV
jgi:predicted ATPase